MGSISIVCWPSIAGSAGNSCASIPLTSASLRPQARCSEPLTRLRSMRSEGRALTRSVSFHLGSDLAGDAQFKVGGSQVYLLGRAIDGLDQDVGQHGQRGVGSHGTPDDG